MRLLHDSEKIKARYECKKTKVSTSEDCPYRREPSSDALDDLAASFSYFRVPDQSMVSPPRPKREEIVPKTRWAVCDRKKFTKLIDEVKGFVDGLQDITESISTVARQEGMMRFGVQQIKDTDTLQIVSDVCENDYPDISDAASIKLDVLTITTTRRDEIEAGWMKWTFWTVELMVISYRYLRRIEVLVVMEYLQTSISMQLW
jgi:hypothetical protein